MQRPEHVRVRQERLLPDKPPFSNTGVDYFGPFGIERGCTKVKRYGALFTCLTVRAVHIEVTHSQHRQRTLLMRCAASKPDEDKYQSFIPTMAQIWLVQ